jgi:hypothetical protein
MKTNLEGTIYGDVHLLRVVEGRPFSGTYEHVDVLWISCKLENFRAG